ncbi:EB1 domain-containing protein [Russula earlei]|uniref:EB1 domain-containing protein n=1 Tax=Russula earlei TaxID=71964 RepID=A0ACC0TSB1_9AGAM|nr:EB1 domain-containing protein [Russula earlei]
MAESRSELLAWLNELLQINYTRIEQCGTGGAYCQILDSVYLDVPMTRVKMNAKHEYEFIANFKVMQNVFKAKRIEKPIPVEKLVKCKMQDNLEFLQWMKRFWDTNYPGHQYDPVARRRGQLTETPATLAPIASRVANTTTSAAGARSGGKTPVGGHRAGSASAVNHEQVLGLQAQLKEMSAHLEGLEKERDFYFAKLRDIEILVQQQMEDLAKDNREDFTLAEIQKILYSTEEGFEVPDNAAATGDEEETF